MMTESLSDALKRRIEEANDQGKVKILFEFVMERGQSNYDESVTQIEHALQCADLATQDGCSDAAVTAALFHDIGHLLLDEHDAQAEFLEEDLNHEAAGAKLLTTYFPEEITEPIRLHVAAKRYLCTIDPDYYDSLSEASKHSYQLQGGRLSSEEKAELEANPGLEIAVRLRRFDDLGKKSDCPTPAIETYLEQVQSCLRPSRA